MDEKQLKALYDAMSSKLDLPEFNTFKGQLADDKFRKAFYDEASTDLDLGDFDTFSSSFKKKESTTASAPSVQPVSQSGAAPTEVAAPVADQEPALPIDDFTKRYKSRVEAGTNYLDAKLKDKMLKQTDVNLASDYSEFFSQAKKMNAEGKTKDRVQYVYDFLNKNSDINTNKETRDAFISSQYAGEYYSTSPSLKSDYEGSGLNKVLTPRQYTGYKSLTFGQKDYADKLLATAQDPNASEQDREIAKISLDNYGIDVDKDAASSMLVKDMNKDVAGNLYKSADGDFYANKEKVRELEYQNPYSLTSISGIVERATKRGIAMGETADIFTATSKESGVDVNKLAEIQSAQRDARSSKAYEQFSEDPSWENFKKNPIGILTELSLESLVALYSHGASRIAAGAATGAAMGAPIMGIGAAAGASSGAIAGMGMTSLNLEFSSTLIDGISGAGYDVTNPEDLKKAFADERLMSDLKSTAYKKGIPVAIFDMISAGVAGKMLAGAKTVGGKILAGTAETAAQAAAGAGGEATSQLVAYGKITSPNAILMEAIGEIGPGVVEIAYGNIVENAKRNKPQSNEDLVTAAANKDQSLNAININQGAGILTKEQADAAKQDVLKMAEMVNKMPEDMSDKAKAEAAPLIEQRNNLQKQIESVDESFKPQLKSQLDGLDKQIQDIYIKDKENATTTSKGVVQEGVPESGIVQPTRAEAQGQEAAQPETNVGNRPISGERQVTAQDVEVSSNAEGFAQQMTAAQESLGGAGLSVSPYSQEEYDAEAKKGGKFFRADNNNILGLLKSTGEMVSLVKNAASKAKGAAQAVINSMKEKGGLFMDNYDIYLTPLYEKAGYKVIARVPFNEQYAPEGWDAEGSTLKGKPDVVFMVRNDIAPATEQKFDSYEQAAEYTKSIVDKAVTEGKVKTPVDIGGISKTIDTILPNVQKSLAASGVDVQIVDNEEDAVKIAGEAARGNQGVFISKEGKIVIDQSKLANAIEAGVVVWHEASHPVMNIIRNTNKPLYDKISAGLRAAAEKNQGVKDALNWATEQYSDQGEGTVSDESIVETIGRIGAGVIDPNSIETGVKQALIDFINSIAKAFGFDQILDDTDVAAFKRVATQVADALRTGRGIEEIVGAENVKATEAQTTQLKKKSSDIAKITEEKTVEGKTQPSMILTGKKKGETVELYSGAASIEALRTNKPDMYVSRAQELADTHLVPGKTKNYRSDASTEQKLKWADSVYAKAKATVVSNLLFIYDSIPAHIRDISKLWYDGANIISQELAKKYNTTLEQAAAVVAAQSPQKPWYDNVHLGHFIMDFFANKQDMVMSQEVYDYFELKSQPTKAVPAGYPKQKEYLPTLKKAIGKKFSELSEYDKSVMIRYDFDNNYDRRAPLRIPTGAIVGKVTSNSAFSGYDTIAKGVSILQDGSPENISKNLGKAFKVRNFNNNIVNPKMDGEVTIDTHAMAAGYMLPLGASSTEVKFDEGTYSFFADAYREAAKQRGVLAREMQSIVWEGVRSIFPAEEKSEAKKAEARKIWSNYKNQTQSINEVQNQIKENGKDLSITDWSRFTDTILEENAKPSYVEELSVAGRNQPTAEPGVGRGAGRGLPGVGEGGVQPSQASKGNRQFSEEPLTDKQINSLRTSLRNSYPDSVTLQTLDDLQKAKKSTELIPEGLASQFLDNGINLGDVATMLLEDGMFEDANEIRRYFNNIGGLDGKGLSGVQFSKGGRAEMSKTFKLATFVMRKKKEGASTAEIVSGVASVTGMKPEDIKQLVDNPEQWLKDQNPNMTDAQKRNLVERAKIQNIYRGRSFGLPIDKAFTGMEVSADFVNEYLAKNKAKEKNFIDSVKDFKKKWLDPARGLPDWILAEKDFASGAKNIEIARAMKTIEGLKEEAKKIGFSDWDAFSEALIAVNDVQRFIPDITSPVPFDAARAAEGKPFTTPDDQLPALVPDAIKNLPESIIPFVYKMRAQIDGLTKDLVASGYVTPEQAVTLEKNIGAYVNRSYKMYNEKGWKPAQEQIVDAIKYLADQYVKELATDNAGVLTYEQVMEQAVEKAKKDVQAIMDKKRNPYFNASVDSRNTGILKERQDIPEPIRQLMGEYTDPGTVFIMTVAKQAALKASSQYLSKMREFGLGSIFFEKNDPNRPADFSVQIATPGSETKSPLDGLYTTPEIAETLESQDPTYNDITNLWMKLIGAVRWGKTVGSVVTQFKNFESNLGFAVMNGLLFSGKNTQAFKGAGQYVKGQYSKKEIDAITEKAIKLSLVGQSVGARELSVMLGSGDIHDIALDIAVNPEGRLGKKIIKKFNVFGAANKLYRMGDDFWKVYAYLNEREMVSRGRYEGKAYSELTEQEQEKVDIESSERVKNTWPTYDRVVEAAKKLSKSLPILGNFPSFQAESVRTLVNTVKMAREDMRDPQMRAHGVRRAVGIATYLSVRAALTYAAAQAAGMAASGIMGKLLGDDDEERKKHAMKHALPPYAVTSDIFAIQNKAEPHKYTVYSLSSMDPYGIMFGSVNALTEGREGIFGKRMEPGVPAAAIEFFSSFLEPEMTFDAVWSITNNTNAKTGRPIVNDSDTDLQAFEKVMGYVWDQLEPSTVSLAKRGVERGWSPELASFAGARPIDVDLHKAFSFVLSDMAKQMEVVNNDYNKIKYNEKFSKEEKDAAEADAENRKAYLIQKTNVLYREFIELGANPKQLDEIIKNKSAVKTTGFDKATKKYIKTGVINPKNLFK